MDMDYVNKMIDSLIEAQSKHDNAHDSLFEYIQFVNDREDYTRNMLLITRKYVKLLEQRLNDLRKELDELKYGRQN